MTHDIFTLMASRRSTRHFSTKPVEMDKLLQIVQAGVLAPSAGNLQNYKFIIVSDVAKIKELYHITLEQEAFLSAPAAIIVLAEMETPQSMYGVRGERLYAIQNCAAAMENMLLAAHALDLGSVWIGAFDEDRLADLFEIPSDQYRPQAILLFGYPAGPAEPRELKPLDAFVFFNKWENRLMKPHLVRYDWADEWRLQGQRIKGHVQHIVHKEKDESAPKREILKETKEKAADVKKRMREIIDDLKKDEYRSR